MPDFQPPRYAYVPGQHPHPVRDPAGHAYGQIEPPLAAVTPEELNGSPVFREAVELFNRGYYWEAHEVWEWLWHAAGRQGFLADFLKALIKLAAAGVKAREGNAEGVARHAARAAELLQAAAAGPAEIRRLSSMIHGETLLSDCKQLAANPVTDATPSITGRPVLGIVLKLSTQS